jgi:sec-independent protein translocase protein TatA
MPFVGHLPEVLILLLIALLVFGPKRMIEMGAQLGKAFRELREATKDIPGMSRVNSLGGLLDNTTSPTRRTSLSSLSQMAQHLGIDAEETAAPAAPSAPSVGGTTSAVEGTVERVEEHSAD